MRENKAIDFRWQRTEPLSAEQVTDLLLIGIRRYEPRLDAKPVQRLLHNGNASLILELIEECLFVSFQDSLHPFQQSMHHAAHEQVRHELIHRHALGLHALHEFMLQRARQSQHQSSWLRGRRCYGLLSSLLLL